MPRVTAYLDHAEDRELDALCTRLGVSRSYVIRAMVRALTGLTLPVYELELVQRAIDASAEAREAREALSA